MVLLRVGGLVTAQSFRQRLVDVGAQPVGPLETYSPTPLATICQWSVMNPALGNRTIDIEPKECDIP